jgi:6-phosphofructokinase 2
VSKLVGLSAHLFGAASPHEGSMKRIVTLTINPAIDAAAEAEVVRPIRKIRTWGGYDPGRRDQCARHPELGGTGLAIYLSGGMTGSGLDRLLRATGIKARQIPIAGSTRVSHTVHEKSSGLDYRFVPQGPVIEQPEWEASLAAVDEIDCDYLVASGSLPRGVPDDFYVRVADIVARKRAKLILDTSGEPLRKAAERGVHLIKPSLGELEELTGRELPEATDQEQAVRALIDGGAAEMVTLTLGRDGALLGTRSGLRRIDGLTVKPKSAVGAGDSFLAAMTLGLAQERDPADAFALAVAAGTAAVMAGRSSAVVPTWSGSTGRSRSRGRARGSSTNRTSLRSGSPAGTPGGSHWAAQMLRRRYNPPIDVFPPEPVVIRGDLFRRQVRSPVRLPLRNPVCFVERLSGHARHV